MREGRKTLIVACVALLLAVGLVACGGGDSSDSTGTKADGQAQVDVPGGEAAQSGGDDKSGSGGQGKAGSDGSSTPDASDFVPRQHSDSGGGAEQFKVKGGDNSVQEFGEEADPSEFDAAATALHNFLDARAEGNWAAACDYMAKGTTESIEKLAKGSGCAGVLEKLIDPAARPAMKAEAEKADVRALRTEGEQAFLIYTGTEGTVLAMPMANEDGEWKVSALTGSPLN